MPATYLGNGPALRIEGLAPFGRGAHRPEQVLVTAAGRVFASDKSAAVCECFPDGSISHIGAAGGEPNGIAMAASGEILIANFGSGTLQELNLRTGVVRSILTSGALGRDMTWINFVLVDRSGGVWASCSTASADLRDAIVNGKPDGFIIHMEADGSEARVVADGLNFPNCMALDQDESYLYVVRTTPAGVVRLRIRAGRDLDPSQQFGPDLGGRRPDEYGDRVVESLGDPQLQRRWGMADGCAFDAAGNLWVTVVGANRIVAITPDETVIPLLDDPDGHVLVDPTSIAWGGPDMRDVYIGSITSPHILKGRTSVSGLRMVHQRQVA